MKACPKCAAKNVPTARFCSQCAAALVQSPSPTKSVKLVAPPASKKKGGGIFWIVLGAIAVIGGISAQGGGNTASSRAVQTNTPTPNQLAAVEKEQGVELVIPSDPKAKYQVLAVERGPKGLIYIQSRREGSSGVSFSERQVNCRAKTFAYTREGDTLEALLAEQRKPDPMGPRVQGSISDVVSQHACDHPPEDRNIIQETEAEAPTDIAITSDSERPATKVASYNKDEL